MFVHVVIYVSKCGFHDASCNLCRDVSASGVSNTRCSILSVTGYRDTWKLQLNHVSVCGQLLRNLYHILPVICSVGMMDRMSNYVFSKLLASFLKRGK